MLGGAEQHRLGFQRQSLLAAFENFFDHVARLIGFVADRDQVRPLAGFSLRPQILGEALIREFDHRIGRRQDRLRRAIILLERDDVCARREMAGKIENVAHGGGAKRIDRLRIVADDGQASAVRTQRQEHGGLELVGVLIFVDQHMIEARRDILGDRGLLHHVRPIEQKIVVIEHLLLLLGLDIAAEQRLQLPLPHLAPGKIQVQNLLQRLLAVDGARIDGEAGVFGGKALVGLRETEIVAHEIHQIGGIAAIVDGESRRKANRFRIFAQEPRTDGVEGAGPRYRTCHRIGDCGAAALHRAGENAADPAGHLDRCAPREGQQHDAARIGAALDQMRNPVRQGRGLARAGAGNDEQRSRLGLQ
jgi:hypothetical protein